MATSTTAVPVHDLPRRATRPGGVEDRYRSLFVVGRGGMGAVEVALERAAEGFERVVALKRLLPEQARDPRHKEMFLREARLAALLQHPNVVHAFAFGELYGELFLAMEYVEGETLARVLASVRESGRAIDPALAAFMLAEVCDGLHAAHELRDHGGLPLNVVHRDVSPQNVMIAYEGQVKLLDFGVAKFETGGHETRTGEVKGKMAYMSPEQALGEKLDRRSDLFSVGAVLFECLTGRRMWGPGTDMEVMRRLALEEPPRLDDALPGVSRELVELQARLVARDPASRPATAKDAASELRAIAASWPAPDTAVVRAWMRGLFEEAARQRQAMLIRSLQQAAPTRVESLRKTLDPAATFVRPTLTEAVIVGGGSRSAGQMQHRTGRPARGLWLGGGLLLAVAVVGVVVVGATRRESTAAATTAATMAAVSTASTTPAPAPAPTPTPTPTTARAAPATSTSGATPTPVLSSSPRHPPRAPPRPAPAPAGKLPDVDPAPF